MKFENTVQCENVKLQFTFEHKLAQNIAIQLASTHTSPPKPRKFLM